MAIMLSHSAASMAQPAPVPMGWHEIIDEVERTSPIMQAARAGLDALRAELSRAQWSWFPKIKMDGWIAPAPSITQSDGISVVDYDTWGLNGRLALQVVQPIYTFGKISALEHAAEHGVDMGSAKIDVARWELRHRVAQAYFGSLLASEMERILTDGKRWLEKATQRMDRLKNADSDAYDQLEHMRLKTRSAEFYNIEAQNNALKVASTEGLRVLLSRPSDDAITTAEDTLAPLNYTLKDVNAYVAMARKHAPVVRVAQGRAKAAMALADARFAEILPDLVLVGEASVAGSTHTDTQSSLFPNDPFFGSAVLGLRWNLDVPGRLAQLDSARARSAMAGHGVEATSDQLEVQVRHLHQQLQDKWKLIDVYRRSQKAAKGWLQAAWDVYDGGFGNFRDVMDALVQYYGKRVAYLQSIYEHNLLVVEMSRAIGKDITESGGPAAKDTDDNNRTHPVNTENK